MPLAGREIVDGNLHRMVTPWASHHLPTARYFRKITAFGNFDPHLGWPARRIDIARPQQNRIRPGFTARHIMREAGQSQQSLRHRRATRKHQTADTKSGSCEKRTTVYKK